MEALKKRKILWAFDPTHNPKNAKNIVSELNIWSQKLSCNVQPVCVFSRSTYNFPDVTLPWDKKYKELARKSVTYYLKAAHASKFLPPKIIFVNTFSSRSMAFSLAQYAEKQQALMIFANTHAQKSATLNRIGGFATTLIAASRVPVFLLSPQARAATKISPILFPTDFANESLKALLRLQTWTQYSNTRVILYNLLERPSTLALGPISLNLANRNWNKLSQDIKKSRLRQVVDLKQKLKKVNLDYDVILRNQKKTIAMDIIEMAVKKKVGLIAMATQRGPWGQMILGSTAQEVLLQARCPVLIFYHTYPVRQTVTAAIKGETHEYPNHF